MDKSKLFLLIVIIIISIPVNCLALYYLFLILAMPVGHYLSPWIFFPLCLFLIFVVPVSFILTLVGLYEQKKWAYHTFFIITALLHSFLVFIFVWLHYLMSKRHHDLNFFQISFLVYFIIFVIFFILPSTRKFFIR